MIDDKDPDKLLTDIKDYNICEICGKKIELEYKKCYNCFMEDKQK